ncbi:MAG TPA: hypothetical protein VK669_09050 [Candidatus Limnocylindrales bacterium]|nr:hypothetical protein [Candidatus Limnocylindrales bacterium]
MSDEVASAIDRSARASNARSREAYLRDSFEAEYGSSPTSMIAARMREVAADLTAVAAQPGSGPKDAPSVVRLAKMLEHPDPSAIEAMLRGDIPFPFEVVARIVRYYNVSEEWILEGHGTPYQQPRPPHREAWDLLRDAVTENRDSVQKRTFHVLLEDAERGEATIFEERTEWCWDLLVTNIPVHDHVGGTGEMMLGDLGLFLAAPHLHVVHEYNAPQGYVCSSEVYRKITWGASHPVRIRKDGKHSNWADDLWDLKYSGPTTYSASYAGARRRLLGYWGATDVRDGSQERITSNEALTRHLEFAIEKVRQMRRFS